MFTKKIAVLSLHLFALAACGSAPADDGAAEAAQASTTRHWQSALHCGAGGVEVDVDSSERRNLQTVIRDSGAVAWLSSHPGDGMAGIPNAKGEIILHGVATRGVFSAGDFSGFSELGFAGGEDALLSQAHVNREGNGLRVRLVSWSSGHEVETSNWWFADCH